MPHPFFKILCFQMGPSFSDGYQVNCNSEANSNEN